MCPKNDNFFGLAFVFNPLNFQVLKKLAANCV